MPDGPGFDERFDPDGLILQFLSALELLDRTEVVREEWDVYHGEARHAMLQMEALFWEEACAEHLMCVIRWEPDANCWQVTLIPEWINEKSTIHLSDVNRPLAMYMALMWYFYHDDKVGDG